MVEIVTDDTLVISKKGGMAVALNPTKTLYSKKGDTEDDPRTTKTTVPVTSVMTSASYADSPSRQVRRSARVASLSPSSFTPLISQHSGTSSASSSTSTSSYMPSSPSSKYSMMRGGYNGVSIDEIVINEIEGENRGKIGEKEAKSLSLYPKLESFTNLRSNPDRRHPTLDFQPTNLSTPSTTLQSTTAPQDNKSGITPAVKQINLQETPGQSQRILEKLVTKGDMDEIAKATPLGSFYNRKATENGKENAGAGKSKIQIISEKSKELRPVVNNNSSNSSGNSYSNSNSNSSDSNSYSHSNPLSSLNTRPHLRPQTRPQTHPHPHTLTQTDPQILNHMAKTPQKQTNDPVESDETVKVVRTLRNRSIVASPLPVSSSLRRNNLAFRENKPKIDVTVFFKKHQKNLLAYSLVALFFFATLYHVYDGLINEKIVANERDEIKIPEPSGGGGGGVQPIESNDEILKLIETKFLEIREIENAKILNLIEKTQETFNEKLEKVNEKPVTFSIDAEMQRKALDSVTNSVKSLEKKFQALEAKIEKVEIMNKAATRDKAVGDKAAVGDKEEGRSGKGAEAAKRPHETSSPSSSQSGQNRFADLKIVKHLSTSPIGSGLFKSSDFPPENAINAQTQQPANPFKFAGNRGKLAILLSLPTPSLPFQVIIEHPLLPDRSCAPRDFEIWALQNVLNERDNPILIGKGTFDLSKESQSFKLNQQKMTVWLRDRDRPIVLQLRIRNNHGNAKFTCLYNFKVQL